MRRADEGVVETPLPLIDFYEGVRAQTVRTYRKFGYDSYLLGEYRNNGWWYFFPVVLAVKTPIGFLILSVGGIAAVFLKTNSGSWPRRLTAIFPVVIPLVCLRSRIEPSGRRIFSNYT